MLSSLIAERYAKALLRAAEAQKALADVGAQAEGLAQALEQAEGANRFLADPLAEPGAKLKVMSAAFEGGPHAVLGSFLTAVLEHKRERFLPLILASFLKLRDEAEGRGEASFGTARPMAADELKLLETELGKRLGRTLTLKPYTEKELLGGAVLRMGDTVYDASLRSRLQRLGRLLSEGPPPSRPKRAPESPAKGAAKAKTGSKPKAKAAKPEPKAAAKPKVKAAAKPAKAAAKPKATKPKAKAAAAAKPKKAAVKAKTKAKKASPSNAGQALAAKLLKKPL